MENHVVLVITDERADRMRIITEVAQADKLSQKMLFRMMQANFDAALDARYAVAHGRLWSAFIHPAFANKRTGICLSDGASCNLGGNIRYQF